MAKGMHTGYVHRLLDNNQTFEQFVWSVARSFGAFVTLRDSSGSTPLSFEVDPYHADKLAEAKLELAAWQALSDEERMQWAIRARVDDIASRQENLDTAKTEARKVRDMLQKAQAWTPPTPEHDGLKRSMVETLESDLRENGTDFESKRLREAIQCPASQYLADQTEKLEWDVNYHTKALAEEQERVANRNAWIAALNASVPKPTEVVS